MAGKKIGLVLALDGEQQYTQSLQNAKKETNLLKTEMKNLSQEFDGNANSMDALRAKQENLTKQQEAYHRKLAAAKSGLDNAKKTYTQQADALEELRKKLDDAQKAQKKMEESGDNSSDAYKEQCKQVKELSEAVDKQTTNVLKASGRVTDWNQRVSESEGELRKVNKALDQNEQYLKEAESASDHCATSIDKLGKEVKDAADSMDDANQKSSTFGDVLKANLASGAIVGGIKSVTNVAKEGAEALVGMATEAAAYADEILTTATVTRMSADDLQAYSYAAELVDVSLETLTKSMAKNVKSMDSARDGSESYVEAYGKLGVAVTDANGNLRNSEDVYWDVIDALSGVADETERDAISMQIFGKSAQDLSPLIAQGSDGIAKLKDEAKEMGAVLDGDALTALGATDDSLQRLNQQTEIFKRTIGANIAPVVQDVAEAATKVLSELTDAINPPKSELEQFIDDIKASNDEVQRTLDSAQSVMDGATADVAELEAYKQVLMDLNEQESLTEFQKYQLANAVNALSDSVPGLSESFDAANGTLSITNEELENLFNNAEAVAMQTALIDAQKSSYDALAQATINKAKADSAAKTAQEELDIATSEYQKRIEETGTETNDYYSTYLDAQLALDDATKAQKEANKVHEEASKQIEEEDSALAELKEQYGLIPDATSEAADGVSSVGKAVEETGRVFDEYGNDITGMSEEQADAVTEASKKIVDAYSDMRDGIADSIKGSMSLFDEFSGGEETSASKINQNLESQITGIEQWSENMNTLAGEIGGNFTQELYDELAAMGPEQSASAVNALVEALNSDSDEFKKVSENWSKLLTLQTDADTIAQATSAGKEYMSAVSAGIEEGTDEVKTSTVQSIQAAADAANEQVPQFEKAGTDSADRYIEAIRDAKAQASAAGGAMAFAAKNAAAAWQSSFNSVGYNMAAGMASGINSGSKLVSDAARRAIQSAKNAANNEADSHSPSRLFEKQVGYYISAGMAKGILDGQRDIDDASRMAARTALKSAKEALDIRSPSGKFRKQVGQQVGKGFAFGIQDSAALAGAEASNMSEQVYANATAWLTKYKKSHKVSLENEKWYWQQISKHTSAGTDAYNKAISKMLTASVPKTTKSGKKTVKKDAETYYSEIYSAASKYLSNQQILNDWSLQQELSYWQSVRKQLKSGTQAWYDATKQIKDIQKEIDDDAKEAAENAKKSAAELVQTRANVQKDILDKYKVYYKVSAKAEMDYWDIARKQFSEGTDERIEADQKYLEARSDYYDQLAELDKDYAEKKQEIDDDLADSINELNDAYEDAVKSREDEIKSSMNLFEEWDATGYTSDTLMRNLKTQVNGLKFWEQQLKELKNKGLTQELLDELESMGPEAAANIYSLNQMTAEELDEYNKLWDEKNELAHRQAVQENEKLLKENDEAIKRLRANAQNQMQELDAEYRSALSDLNEELSDGLKGLVEQAGSIGEEIVSSLIAGLRKASESGEIQSDMSAVAGSTSGSETTGNTSGGEAAVFAEAQPAELSEKEKILAAIDKGTDHKKKITDAEKKEHHALWEYLVSKYKKAPNKSVYKELAGILGVSASDTPTADEKTKILNKLKKKGYAKGTRRILEDDLAWIDEYGKQEYVVRKSDGAILQNMMTGDKVIDPQGSENIYDFATNPRQYIRSLFDESRQNKAAAYQSALAILAESQTTMQHQQAALQEQIKLLDLSGIAALNQMLQQQVQPAVVNVDNNGMMSILERLIQNMDTRLERIENMKVVIYPDVLAGELQAHSDKASGEAIIKRNRGRSR